ncbi:hypothetical protein PV328_011046 [Microctonus aethiopoides]|uniref:Uncharacterized protein n=1 Tax=Microctonus aethiopoides TaxID=144406 RepID=A0AA39EZW6_9HYME|nr:hypothetical protein PV328_011046 [Microctonus aethiopoides]
MHRPRSKKNGNASPKTTDDDPKHDNCPVGADSWRKWKKAEALGTKPPVHPKPLHHDVQKAILPIYKDLSRDDLIERCLEADNRRIIRQNRRSSVNSKESRKARQEKLRAENDAYEAAEGLQYGAGIAD